MDNEILTAITENRCYICGTEQDASIKVLDKFYKTNLSVKNFIPICNICLEHYPVNADELSLIHLIWTILSKRLNQQRVYTKMCRNCKILITTARKEKEFCSNNCRSKFWQKQHYVRRES